MPHSVHVAHNKLANLMKSPQDTQPFVTLDCVIFGFAEESLQVLLVEWPEPTTPRRWALPGGFIKENMDLDTSAQIVLEGLTGVGDIFMEQIATFGNAGRVPTHRAITVAYYALVAPAQYQLKPGPDNRMVQWFNIKDIPPLIYDHQDILEAGWEYLRKKIREEPIGFELLPEKFTLTQIQNLYQSILDGPIDKRNTRKKLLNMNLLTPLNEMQQGVAHRAARLYSFDKEVYEKLKEEKKLNFDFKLLEEEEEK